MTFVKLVKSKAYFKRYQTKFRRRREGKTDFYARQRLVLQDKNKFGSPKYRMIVRFSNKSVICQVAAAGLKGDEILASAVSAELKNYGLTAGLTNYAATYATGLLLARRLLASKNMDSLFEGVSEVTGEFDQDSTTKDGKVSEDGRRPFRMFLDVGLKRTVTGAKVFAALKGAVDGGIHIRHNPKRFYGYDDETKQLDVEAFRERLFGGNVTSYMEQLQEEDAESYKARFSQYIKAGITAENYEETLEKVHAGIRAEPNKGKKERKAWTGAKRTRRVRMSLQQRKDRVKQKFQSHALKLAAEEEDDE